MACFFFQHFRVNPNRYKEFVYFIQGDRIYTVAYIASSAEFEDIYPTAQKIIDFLTFNT